MAIEKNKQLSNGSSGNYWKIINESYDKLQLKAVWVIALFKDHQHSLDNKPHLGLTKLFKCDVTKEELEGDRTALGYTKIKELCEDETELPVLGSTYDSDLADGEDV